jgi:hypothetical protein
VVHYLKGKKKWYEELRVYYSNSSGVINYFSCSDELITVKYFITMLVAVVCKNILLFTSGKSIIMEEDVIMQRLSPGYTI